MRPPVPDVVPHRSRKSSFEQPQSPDPRSTAPATFFLARSSTDSDPDAETSQEHLGDSRESMYGVQSLDESAHQASLVSSSDIPSDGSSSPPPHEDPHQGHDGESSPPCLRRRSTLRPFDLLNPKVESTSAPPSDPPLSRPLTPLHLLSNPDDPSSLPSSPKSITNQSIKHLDDISIGDDLSSQAVASGDEDDDPRQALSPGPDNNSQLIMPSLRMPSRRPFTERGKGMGRLKVLLAGAPGSGKTSLIKSIVQACEDIVHVDPLPPPVPLSPRRSSRPQPRTTQTHGTSIAVSEIYASTKPYPSWWSDLEDSRVLRRRKSLGDIVLERNLCFVDTPSSALSQAAQTDAIVQYMHQQLIRATTSLESMNIDFQNLLAGNGGSQVDTVLYLISTDTLAMDIECIRRLCDLTNVIPVISKADLLLPNQITTLKSSFHRQAQAASIKPFLFGDSGPGGDGTSPRPPFVVSSAHSSDDDVMDASTLMNPDYVQPLTPSELGLLVKNIFDRDNLAWMRHSAAKKLTQCHRYQPYRRQEQETAPNDPLSPLPSSMSLGSPVSSMCSSGIISLSSGCSPSYTMARITDYTQQEEKLAQVQLAKWAADLQRSLHNERKRYTALASGDRAVWLTERLSECVNDGSVVPITQQPPGFCGLHGLSEVAGGGGVGGLLVRAPDGREVEYHFARLSPLDPLGVVRWMEDLKRRGWTIVQIVGSFGIVGGLALWLAKTWGFPSRSLAEWHFNW